MIDSASSLAKSDGLGDIEKLEQVLCQSPDLSNLIKQYKESIKSLRANGG